MWSLNLFFSKNMMILQTSIISISILESTDFNVQGKYGLVKMEIVNPYASVVVYAHVVDMLVLRCALWCMLYDVESFTCLGFACVRLAEL
jgi:hypothetical protein